MTEIRHAMQRGGFFVDFFYESPPIICQIFPERCDSMVKKAENQKEWEIWQI
jgi:hypothetical protein